MNPLFEKAVMVRIVNFFLNELKELLVHSGLYSAVRAVQYSIPKSNYQLYAMLECYNLKTYTFFYPVGEMVFALHEMYEVSGLTMGDIPYKEYIPGTEEFHLMKKDALLVYKLLQ